MNFINKIKWVLGILMVFILIITTNLIDKNNFIQIRDSVVTIYEDRLVAKDLITESLKQIHQKELALYSQDTSFYKKNNTEVNQSIEHFLNAYEQTKFTKDENKIYQDFKKNLQKLNQKEDQYIASGFQESSGLKDQVQLLKKNLNDLSEIQVIEGKKQVSLSNKAAENVALFTQIEIYVLIFLAILIQIVVMYNPKK